MAFTVSVGEVDFAALRNSNAYYVDKAEMIYELVHDTNNKVTLFTRPRRFGKTLMMSMMENFFNIYEYEKAAARFAGSYIRTAASPLTRLSESMKTPANPEGP